MINLHVNQVSAFECLILLNNYYDCTVKGWSFPNKLPRISKES